MNSLRITISQHLIWILCTVVFALSDGQFWGCVDYNCYEGSSINFNQYDANKYCEERNLTSGILSLQDYKQIKVVPFAENYTWIGIRRYAKEQWTYLSGHAGPVVNSTYPAQQKEVVCAYQNISQVYSDACYKKKKYVCQNVTGQTDGNSSVHLSWFEARNDCITRGGDLYDPNVHGWKIFGNEQYWIGVRKDLWTWTATGKEVKMTNWSSTQPYGNGSCVTFTKNGWYLFNCKENGAKALCVKQTAPVIDAISSSSSSTSSSTLASITTISTSSSSSSSPSSPSSSSSSSSSLSSSSPPSSSSSSSPPSSSPPSSSPTSSSTSSPAQSSITESTISNSEETFSATQSPPMPNSNRSASMRPPQKINPSTDSDAFSPSTSTVQQNELPSMSTTHSPKDADSNNGDKNKIDDKAVVNPVKNVDDNNKNKIIGGVIGGVLGLIVVIVIIGLIIRQRQHQSMKPKIRRSLSDDLPEAGPCYNVVHSGVADTWDTQQPSSAQTQGLSAYENLVQNPKIYSEVRRETPDTSRPPDDICTYMQTPIEYSPSDNPQPLDPSVIYAVPLKRKIVPY